MPDRGWPHYSEFRNAYFISETLMDLDWQDLRLFLDVARQGGLNAAARATGMSAATLGRRVGALEERIGEPLFVRSQSGYRLTRTGEELLERAQEVEEAMAGLARWHNEAHGERVVRISAGHWTSYFLARHIRALWQPEDRFRIELVTADEKVDIGHRHADIGIRNARPTEQWLAGRLIGHVAYGTYSGRELIGGVKAGMFIGFTTDADVPSVRWLEAHHADRIGVRGNNAASVRELVAGGAGLTVLPCFIGDADKRLVRVAPIIDELTSEQWLVAHHDERHSPPVRRIADRIAQLMRENRDLMLGRRPQPNSFEG